MSWFSRMITLPKAHNSLSDLIGAEASKVVADTIHHYLAGALITALTGAVAAGNVELERLGVLLTGAVHGVLQGISPPLSASIEKAITDGLKNAETVIESDVPTVVSEVIKEISVVLKIS